MAGPALRLVEAAEECVPLPLSVLERAVADAESLADDLIAGLEAAEHRVWADSRAAAVNEINRLALRVERMRDDFAALTGEPSPTKPRRVA